MSTGGGAAGPGGSIEGNDAVAPRQRRQNSRLGVFVGVAGFLVVMLIGAVIVLAQSTAYTAKVTLVILPGSAVPVNDYSNYLDTLSHGQIAQTATQILQLKQFSAQASRELHLSPANAAASKVQATVQAGTSLLTVTSTAPTGPTAERLADTVVRDATPTVNNVSSPYVLSVVSPATNSARSNGGLSLGKFLAVLIVVGLALAVGAQQATNQLQRVFGRRRGTAPTATGVAPPANPHWATAPSVNGDAGRPPMNGRHAPVPSARAARRTKRAVPPRNGLVTPGGASAQEPPQPPLT